MVGVGWVAGAPHGPSVSTALFFHFHFKIKLHFNINTVNAFFLSFNFESYSLLNFSSIATSKVLIMWLNINASVLSRLFGGGRQANGEATLFPFLLNSITERGSWVKVLSNFLIRLQPHSRVVQPLWNWWCKIRIWKLFTVFCETKWP